jgi:hypothetical protein
MVTVKTERFKISRPTLESVTTAVVTLTEMRVLKKTPIILSRCHLCSTVGGVIQIYRISGLAAS